ncbi:MAG: hypothetical protein MJ071_04595 [Oscillospiraceae bacterium]|nr:hypothetical protein [Oscillospiraceae bacterium]
MARCAQCGSEQPDFYKNCPQCGGAIIAGPAGPAAPTAVYTPAGSTRQITTVGGWFGWTMLLGFLPIIGAVIMMLTSKDETAKNYAKLMLILQIVGIVLSIAFNGLMASVIENML